MQIKNPFVYKAITDAHLSTPTIEARLDESYAQRYEDVILMALMRAYCVKTGKYAMKFGYLEIGANHPVATSSSFLLYRNFNVTGFLVEPNPVLAEELRKSRPNDIVIEVAVVADNSRHVDFHLSPNTELSSLDPKFVDRVAQTIQVDAVSINYLLMRMERCNYDEFVLFIDCEGKDVEILESMSDEFRPIIVQIEASEERQPGNTAKISANMTKRGYKLICHTDVNLIYMDEGKI